MGSGEVWDGDDEDTVPAAPVGPSALSTGLAVDWGDSMMVERQEGNKSLFPGGGEADEAEAEAEAAGEADEYETEE